MSALKKNNSIHNIKETQLFTLA